MDTSSATAITDTRRLANVLMRRLASVKNADVGRAIGRDESTVSRIGSGELGIKLDDLQGFLTALNLKVVDINQHCIDKEIFASYKALAKAAMNAPQRLDWDVPE